MSSAAVLPTTCLRGLGTASIPAPGSRDELIIHNIPFVIRVAREYQGQGLPLEDLLMEGALGLLQAAEHFDPSRGVHFITYAVWWIRRAVVNAIASSARQVRLPRYRSQQFRRARQCWIELATGLGRAPTSDDIATSLGTTVAEAIRRLHSYPAEVPIEGRGRTESRDSLRQMSDPGESPESALIERDTLSCLREAMGSLSQRERAVLVARFGLDGSDRQTLRQLGSALGLTKERVRQIETRAVRRLRLILATRFASGPRHAVRDAGPA